MNSTSGHAPDKHALSDEERRRYARQLSLPEVGPEGQLRLKASNVLIIGVGGLGSPAAIYLAAAGIGRLGLADADTVEHSNLHRQILHGADSVGTPKLLSARDSIRRLNPHTEVVLHEGRVDAARVRKLIAGYDVIVDASDNFPTRYTVSDACVLEGKPYVYGSVLRFEGQASVFDARRGPCYRCLYPETPADDLVPSPAESGLLGVVPGLIGLVQAAETIKLLLGCGKSLLGRLLLVDALDMRFTEVAVAKNPECPLCGPNPSIRNPEGGLPASSCSTAAEIRNIAPRELKDLMDRHARFTLLDVREIHEHRIAHLPGCVLIPSGELARRLNELDRTMPIVVYCRTGGRSARAATLLRRHGFAEVSNLNGGILAWADQVDRSMPRY